MEFINNTEKPKSARDVLLAGYRRTNVLAEKVVFRKPLSGATRYAFCPYCRERVKRGGGNWQAELKPLHMVKVELLCDTGEEATVIEEWRYECTVCKDSNRRNRVLTEDDFIRSYAEPPKEPTSRTFKKSPDVVERFLGMK